MKQILTVMENQQATIKDLTAQLDTVEEQQSDMTDNTSKSIQSVRNENNSRIRQLETGISNQA